MKNEIPVAAVEIHPVVVPFGVEPFDILYHVMQICELPALDDQHEKEHKIVNKDQEAIQQAHDAKELHAKHDRAVILYVH